MAMRTRIRRAALGLALWLCAAQGAAQTEPVDEGTRAAARELVLEGWKHFDAGDCVSALDRFERAGKLVRDAPTIPLGAGRCLERLGRWVEAAERYRAAMHITLDAGASEVLQRARADAERALAALVPRIPTLEIALEGESATEVALTLGGREFPAALVGVARPIDPGTHELVARWRGGGEERRELAVREGARERVVLRRPAGASAPPPAPPALPPAAPPPPPPRAEALAEVPSPIVPVVGWVGVALGAAGMVGGTILGLAVLQEQGRLDEGGCRDGVCPPALAEDVDSYNTLRVASTATLVGGAVVLGASVLLLVVAPGAAAEPASAAARGPCLRGGF
jgi:hypothetical protein